MSAYKKNLAVGVTVLAALLLLGWMILRFSDAPFRIFANQEQIKIRFEAVSAEGVAEGTPVYYLGVNVGRVSKVERGGDLRRVYLEALVDPPLPANVEGRIRTQLLGGGASITLVLVPDTPLPPSTRPATAPAETAVAVEPRGRLKADQTLPATFVGVDLMPELSAELRRLTQELREQELIPRLAAAIETFKYNLDKVGRLVDSAHDLFNDEQMRGDLKQSLANLRATSEAAKQTAADLDKLVNNTDTRVGELATSGKKVLATADARIDQLAREMMARLDQTASVMDNLEKATKKLNEGEGSAAKLLNDPALYENLLDTSAELKVTIQDFRRLAEQWEQEGVTLRLNGRK